MANAWRGSSQNWAEEVDAAEAQNGGPLTTASFPTLADASFPSLSEATKGGKKKPQKMALGEFMKAAKLGPSEAELRAQLPTASRGKVPGEEREAGALGGAFKDYGGDRRGEQ